jgi:hypothetical protein
MSGKRNVWILNNVSMLIMLCDNVNFDICQNIKISKIYCGGSVYLSELPI